jgi:hypothetical protein
MSEEDQPPKPPQLALAPAPRASRIPSASANVVSLVPRADAIGALVRKLAADTTQIKWSAHAFDRMAERGITDRIALEVMRRGFPKGDVEAGRARGEWKIKMAYRPNGRREVGVVVLTVRSERLLVKTVEWEDVT